MTTLTAERLREVLAYDPETGIFRWKVSRGRVKSGTITGKSACGGGYRKLRIDGVDYIAHRIAWFYVTGKWPREIDHVNCIKTDNRFANLREATRSQNNANMRSKNPLGKGVSYHKQRRSYVASIKVEGKRKHLGIFIEPLEAAEAYKAAALKYHGEFARC